MQKWIVGVDEAGRGPLAGPVAVGVVLIPADFDWDKIREVNDSKKLSENKRDEIYLTAMKLAKAGEIFCAVEMTPAKAIDKRGISLVIRECIDKGLRTVLAEASDTSTRSRLGLDWGMVEVKLDGSLKAPDYCINQETIIKGDAKEKVIGLASILAKVTRDTYMKKLAKRTAYQAYHFERHKGYGTVAHRKAIAKEGLSPEHRASYCKNIKMC